MKLYKHIIDGIIFFLAYIIGVVIVTFYDTSNPLCVGFVLGAIAAMSALTFNVTN